MLNFPPSVRIRLATDATDMRKQFDGLAALASHLLQSDVMFGHVFVFCNRRRDRIKLPFWDRSGSWLLCRRLEQGTRDWPVEITGGAHGSRPESNWSDRTRAPA